VVQAGNDFEQLEPGVDRVKDNLKETPKEVVTDGGYVSKDTIVAMKEAVSQLLWKKRKAYSLGIPKTNWLME